MQPHRSEADGVPAYWLDAPPPFAAHLVFRVGGIDEPLPRRGVTHLVEHLVMDAVDPPRTLANAEVGLIFTRFYAEGERQRVMRFITDVCATLSNLPFARLETERRMMKLESERLAGAAGGELLAQRFGARGPGVVIWRERGLDWLGEDEVAAWARSYFTAGNAALWMTGPPEDERLPLPAGPRRPPIVPPPLDQPLPAFRHVPQVPPLQVAVGALVERSAAARAAAVLFEQRAWRTLRRELGISYDIEADYEPLSATVAHVVVAADHTMADAQATVDAMHAITRAAVTDEEMAQLLEGIDAGESDASRIAASLDAAVESELLGREFTDPDDVRQEASHVGADVLAETSEAMLRNAIWLLPEGTRPPDGLEPIPDHNGARIAGTRFPPRWSNPLVRLRRGGLILGGDAAAFGYGRQWRTVRFDEVQAFFVWRNGWRSVLPADTAGFDAHPRHLRRGEQALRALEARMPRAAVAHLDADFDPEAR